MASSNDFSRRSRYRDPISGRGISLMDSASYDRPSAPSYHLRVGREKVGDRRRGSFGIEPGTAGRSTAKPAQSDGHLGGLEHGRDSLEHEHPVDLEGLRFGEQQHGQTAGRDEDIGAARNQPLHLAREVAADSVELTRVG